MGMMTLLTLTSMFGSLSTMTPPVSYNTKLDVWMVACIVFVFATLAEFTVAIFLKHDFKAVVNRSKVRPRTARNQQEDWIQDVLVSVENVSKVAFPLAFIAFSVFYVVYLMEATAH